MKRKFSGQFNYLCDQGKVRKSNEDVVKGLLNTNNDVLLFVADGMGGHNKGEYASNLILNCLTRDFLEKKFFFNSIDAYSWLIKEGKKINTKMFDYQEKNEDFKGMGSTLCAVIITKSKFIVMNVGDSRCYILKDKKLIQMTEDHTYVNYLVKSGQISEKEALIHPKRHYLTNCVGINPSFSCDISIHEYHGEPIFICSDGLYNNVSIQDIEANLNTKVLTNEKVKNLVNLANFNGGTDNISCILWECFND